LYKRKASTGVELLKYSFDLFIVIAMGYVLDGMGSIPCRYKFSSEML
jgi:hypothetical protein